MEAVLGWLTANADQNTDATATQHHHRREPGVRCEACQAAFWRTGLGEGSWFCAAYCSVYRQPRRKFGLQCPALIRAASEFASAPSLSNGRASASSRTSVDLSADMIRFSIARMAVAI